ncbi:hypothetical protein OUZ56_007319 [Daphnia magna]|uniref:Uncharacterized protein n=1 Tax=Daphnia magna TaxID=35525 RepID=A0ABQ9YYF1_9CRUS|nr:hypothetical protein OUZ56_007319 [Daphnia magna]
MFLFVPRENSDRISFCDLDQFNGPWDLFTVGSYVEPPKLFLYVGHKRKKEMHATHSSGRSKKPLGRSYFAMSDSRTVPTKKEEREDIIDYLNYN